jgi:hypothetical protein
MISSTACADELQIGTTFSPTQSEYLGLNWQDTYLAILQSGFDVVRLGTYWSQIEPKPDAYDFRTLDWQLDQARRLGVPVVLTVGVKAPRWPEYFIPEWVREHVPIKRGDNVARFELVRARALKFIRTVVTRYRDDPIIRCWQVENEPFDRSGPDYWWSDREFVTEEVALVRALDTRRRPIVMTVATYPNGWLRFGARVFQPTDPLPDTMRLCDIVGFNIYPVVSQQIGNLKLYFWTERTARQRYYAGLRDYARRNGRSAWIMELQAEPWEPGHLVYTGDAPLPTANPELARQAFDEFHGLGFSTIFLWGAEYWHFRRVRHQDSGWWNMARGLFQRRKAATDKPSSSR